MNIIPGNVIAKTPLDYDRPGFGWSMVLPDREHPFSLSSDFKAGPQIAALIDFEGNIQLRSSTDGSWLENLPRPSGLAPFSGAHRLSWNGSRLLVLFACSQTISRLDEWDLSLRTWVRRSPNVEIPSTSSFSSLTLVNDEVWGITTGKILRWRLDDLSVLPPILVGNSILNPLAWGNELFIGQNAIAGDLYFWKQGEVETRKVNPSYRLSFDSSQAVSNSYFVAAATSLSSDGWLVWNTAHPLAPPTYLPLAVRSEGELILPKIWKDRYLVYVERFGLGSEAKVRVADLHNPSKPAITLPVPKGINPWRLEIESSNVWLWDQAWTQGSGSSGALIRFPIPDDAQTVVSIRNSRAFERSGEMQFEVRCDPPPESPVTLDLETVSGTAREGIDFVRYQKTVTLSSTAPSLTVSVGLIQDYEVESYETMGLKAVRVSGALCPDPEADGVIVSTGYPAISPPAAFPVNNPWGSGPLVCRVPAGIVAVPPVSYPSSEARPYILRDGNSDWSLVRSLRPLANGTYQPKLLGSSGNIVAFSGPKLVSSNTDNPLLVQFIDVASDVLIGSVELGPIGPSPAMTDVGLLCPSKLGTNSNGAQLYDWVSRAFAWSRPELVLTDKLVPFSGSTWLAQALFSQDKVTERRLSDGLIARVVHPPVTLRSTEEFRPMAGGQGGAVVHSSGGGYLLVPTKDGKDRYHRIKESPWSGLVTEDRVAVVPQAIYGQSGLSLYELESGALLDEIILPELGISFSASADELAIGKGGNRIDRRWLRPTLPGFSYNSVTTSENQSQEGISLVFSESVDYPLQLRVKSVESSSDVVYSSAPVLVSPHQRRVTLPVRPLDDNEVESLETVTMEVEVSGNGHKVSYPVSLVIHDNDSRSFGPRPATMVRSSACAMSASGPIVAGLDGNRSATDFGTSKVLSPSSADRTTWFGHAAAANASQAIIGAPSWMPKRSSGSIYLFDRASGRMIKRLTKSGLTSAFGSVVSLDSANAFVSAPGIDESGVVYGYKLPNAATGKTFKEPGTASPTNRFGIAVASDGTTVWIGAPGSGSGAVYGFRISDGVMIRKLLPVHAQASRFGHSLCLSGPYLVVGSPSADSHSRVDWFNRSTGAWVGSISTPRPADSWFGVSLASCGDGLVAVGVPGLVNPLLGSVMLYDLRGIAPRLLIAMTSEGDLQGGAPPYLMMIGKTGSLSAYGSKISVQSNYKEPLSFIEFATRRDGFSAVLDVSEFFPFSDWKVSAPSERNDEWSYAFGNAASSASNSLRISRVGNSIEVGLPTMAVIRAGAVLRIEESEDLVNWTGIATLDSAIAEGWTIQGPSVELYSSDQVLKVGSSLGSKFFRTRLILAK